MVYHSSSEAETEALGEKLVKTLPAGSVVAFTARLGAGKTAFVRAWPGGWALRPGYAARPLPLSANMRRAASLCSTSTFTAWGGADELFDIGWEDYLRRNGICAVEWSENAAGALEEPCVHVDIRRGAQDNLREITITGGCMSGGEEVEI
jgi:tRNA threonylcarbamoyladenosine biosynthesis protein TsaE